MSAPRTTVATSSGSVLTHRYPVESPLWWAVRLYDALCDRLGDLETYDAYYRGDHPLPWLPEQIQDMARRILKMTRTNYMGLVVDATTERQEVLGFKIGDTTEGDKEAYRIWQDNNLDSLSSEAFLGATKSGCYYWMVAPNNDDPKTPWVTIEHPSQVIIEYDPSHARKRSAALKMWYNDRREMVMATLFLAPTDVEPRALIYKYQGPKDSTPDKWVERVVEGESWPAVNPLKVVPIIEMRNNPQTTYCDGKLTYHGVSEIDDLIDIQDRINKTIADRLVTQDFGAFPQKWATGWAEDDDDDDDQPTVQSVVPGSGGVVKHPAGRVNLGRDRLVVATDENVKFGQWRAAELDPYSGAKGEDVKDIASRSRVPSQYLLGEMVNVSGDALIAAESGLVSKVKQRMRAFGEALEEVVRLYLLAADDHRADDAGCATMWRDPTFRTEAQLVDAVIKKHLSGLISWNQAMEDAGYTPTQIAQNRKDKLADALANAALNYAGLFNAPKLGTASDENLMGAGTGTTAAGSSSQPGPPGGGYPALPAGAPAGAGKPPGGGGKALAVRGAK